MGRYDRINGQVDLLSLANDRYGLSWPTWKSPVQIHCPLHADSTPSARYYGSDRGAYCWTCQRAIDPVGLVAAREGVSLREAADLLSEWYGVTNEPDADEEAVRSVLRLVDAGPDPSPQEIADERRAASVVARAVHLPWEQAHVRLRQYEALDLTDVSGADWLEALRCQRL